MRMFKMSSEETECAVISSVVYPLVGTSYRWEWYTPLVMLLTLVVGFALGRAASIAFFRRKH